MASIEKRSSSAAHRPRSGTRSPTSARLHDRLARGFVTDTELEGDTRLVTFANGMVVRELIVDVDHDVGA